MMIDRTVRPAFSVALILFPLMADMVIASEDGGSPSIFAGDIGNIIWSLLTFLAVVLVLGKFVWPAILRALQKREQFIYNSLNQAKEDRQKAEVRLKEYTERVEKAREEASAIVDEGRRDAEEVRKRILAEAKAEAHAVATRAKKEIEIARDDAVKQLHDQTILLATSVAGKIVRRELAADDHKDLVDEALAEMRRLD